MSHIQQLRPDPFERVVYNKLPPMSVTAFCWGESGGCLAAWLWLRVLKEGRSKGVGRGCGPLGLTGGEAHSRDSQRPWVLADSWQRPQFLSTWLSHSMAAGLPDSEGYEGENAPESPPDGRHSFHNLTSEVPAHGFLCIVFT